MFPVFRLKVESNAKGLDIVDFYVTLSINFEDGSIIKEELK
jgi:hypothetical protein